MSPISFRFPGRGFIEAQIASLLDILDHALRAERLAGQRGMLQRLDPRVRLVAMLAVIVLAISTHRPEILCGLFIACVSAALASGIPLSLLGRGVWLNVLIFSGLLALPALLLVPGDPWLTLPGTGLHLTRQGFYSAFFLLGRAMTTATAAALTLLATPWPHLLKALRTLRIPAIAIVILSMTYRYIFVVLHLSLDMLTARRSRQVGKLSAAQRRRMLFAESGVLLGKSMQYAEGAFLAMQSRGYQGAHHVLSEFRMAPRDWFALAMIVLIGIGIYRHG